MKKIVLRTLVVALVFLGLFTSCKITMTTSKAVGEQIRLRVQAAEDQKKNVWIDLNNNGKKDTGETVTKFDEAVNYTIGSQTIDLYGGVKFLDCKNNQLTSLVSKNAALEELICSANKITTLDVSASTELKRLLCDVNRLQVLDVTKNSKLNYLNCRYNQLAALDISKNKELKEMHCCDNKLKSLDISNNKQLVYFACLDNQLTKFDISRNMQLKYLRCAGNKLTTLDASHSKALQFLECNNNTELTKLNVANGNNRNFNHPWGDGSDPTFNATNCPKLKCIKVDKGFNPNAQIGKGKKWVKDATAIYRNDGSECGSTSPPSTVSKITMTTTKAVGDKIELEIVAFPADQAGIWIDLNNNGTKETGEEVIFDRAEEYKLGAQAITIYGKVADLICRNNQLTHLNVSQNTQLQQLFCGHNPLKALDVSQNTKLKILDCPSNQLTQLDVSQNIALEELFCSFNQLPQLDVSQNTKLKFLDCSSNQLIQLYISKNTALEKLHCPSNQLIQLDISKNKKLKMLWCYNNSKLTKLNAANGNNKHFEFWGSDDKPAFDATNCSKLTCIKVDKGFDPTGLTGKKEWRKDPTESWRNDGSECP